LSLRRLYSKKVKKLLFSKKSIIAKMMLPQKYKFTAENAEGSEVTYLFHKGFSATSAVKKPFFATLSKMVPVKTRLDRATEGAEPPLSLPLGASALKPSSRLSP
jgi:hypothetical protein